MDIKLNLIMLARGGRYWIFLYHDILRKNIAILLYITIFLYFHNTKVKVIILNKEIPIFT